MKKTISNIKVIVKKFLIKTLLKFKNFKSKDSIIIFSEPRSGSTWLMEILTKIPDVIVNWEPLHVEQGVVPKEFKLGWKPNIAKDNTDVKYFNLFNDILTLKKRNDWTLMNVNRFGIKNILNAKYVVTKFVRANLLVPYILNNFTFNTKPIFLIRHPIDVCMSQRKNFSPNNSVSLNISHLKEESLRGFLLSLETSLEKSIANWCLSNIELIKEISEYETITIVFYSDLLLNPVEQTLKIFNTIPFLKQTNIKKIVKEIDFEKKSGSDFNEDYVKDRNLQVSKYIDKLTSEEKKKIQDILDCFNFTLYDAYSPYPKYKL